MLRNFILLFEAGSRTICELSTLAVSCCMHGNVLLLRILQSREVVEELINESVCVTSAPTEKEIYVTRAQGQ